MKTKSMHQKHWDVDSDTGEIIDVDTGESVDFTEGSTAEHVAALPDLCREFMELIDALGDHMTRAEKSNSRAALKKAGVL